MTSSLAPDQIRVRIIASGINRADLLQRDRAYLPPEGESDVPGLELSGVVIEHAPDAGFRTGDRVCALVGSGAHGDERVMRSGLALPIGETLSDATAAVLPEALATAWWNLVRLAAVQPEEHVLITGANSGVGHIMVQVARALGAGVIAGTRGTRWHQRLSSLGATPLDMKAPDAVDRLRSISPAGVDVVVDLIGASVSELITRSLAKNGRWLAIGVLGGTEVRLSLRDVIRGRWTLTGSSIRSLPEPDRIRAMSGVRDELWPLVAAGAIRPTIHSVIPRDRRDDAYRVMEEGGFFGKIVLQGEHP